MKKVRIDITVSALGAATAYSEAITGELYAVQTIDGDFADGVSLVLTCENDASIALLTKASFNTDGIYYPRAATNAVGNGAALTDYCRPILAGRVKAVITDGGVSTTGGVIVYYEDYD
jgi:hypothetical protein